MRQCSNCFKCKAQRHFFKSKKLYDDGFSQKCKACVELSVNWIKRHKVSHKKRKTRYFKGSQELLNLTSISARKVLVRVFFRKTVFSYHARWI